LENIFIQTCVPAVSTRAAAAVFGNLCLVLTRCLPLRMFGTGTTLEHFAVQNMVEHEQVHTEFSHTDLRLVPQMEENFLNS
jgi:hypothetical protein